MHVLSSNLRKQLETSVLAARRTAESASRSALDGLGIFLRDKPGHLDAEQAALRIGLRAKLRQLGGEQEVLVGECAYEQWHRLLFARFLAENNLLLHPQFKAPVTLADCDELADELGEPDGWSVAARFASEILPGIFRLDDPCVRLRLAPEGRYALEQILDGLPNDVFAADDALGWVYQFWQKDKKNEINASERKIGGADLGPVTQLFTENYMVRFLLENSLGAWWAVRHPQSPLVKAFEYLRFNDEGEPAAGPFTTWPDRVAEVTVMDPCCGSGHFLVEAFSMLWQMRAEEEGLNPVDAQDRVLRDNLFGLEIDPRCIQIAAFAVALQAWKAGGGWRELPVPSIACTGIPVKAPVEEWKSLAGGDERLETALTRMHVLFRDADTLGSLIDLKRVAEDVDPVTSQRSLDEVDWNDVAPLIGRAIESEANDPAMAVLGADVVAAARTAELLSRHYTLVVTNPPFLGRAKQGVVLRAFLNRWYGAGAADLSTSFLSRGVDLLEPNGCLAIVTPDTWRFIPSFAALRDEFFSVRAPLLISALGSRPFRAQLWDYPICLIIAGAYTAAYSGNVALVTVEASPNDPVLLAKASVTVVPATEAIRPSRAAPGQRRLSDYADVYEGLSTGDGARFTRFWWEASHLSEWELLQVRPHITAFSGGAEECFFWQHGTGILARDPGARIQGLGAWGKRGVLVERQSGLRAANYLGTPFFKTSVAIIPHDPANLPALWHFCSSEEYRATVRKQDPRVGIATSTTVNVPFDLKRWQRIADEAGPLPKPWSDDPTQWLFEGQPEASTASLQVAAGRLVGFRWPEQAELDVLDQFADADGIVCLPSVAGEPPAADRVQQLLAVAFGEAWSAAKAKALLVQARSKKKNIAEWLRDEFFKQHCTLFGNRPFVWHIWDGLKDGFSVLVNYHRLDRKILEKLTYSYLGQDWVERQRVEVRDEIAGAEARLSAALNLQRKLEAILEGEEPFDIYVRWKEQHEQPIGWEPDLNDGVRLNIRPFMEAGVLRSQPNIHWNKDRGRNPDGSERQNDKHLSLAEKREARKRARNT